MLSFDAFFETPAASRYLQQLCKQFGHKVPVTFTPESGLCNFAYDEAELTALDGRLAISVRAEDTEMLAQTKDVVKTHLLRVAFRESPSALEWTP